MNTIEALQKLYVAMGGNEEDVENLNITPDMISAIADIAEGGGGGKSALVAHYTLTPSGDTSFSATCDKTFAELKAAFDEDKDIQAFATFGESSGLEGSIRLSAVAHLPGGEGSSDVLGHFGTFSENNQVYHLTIYHNSVDNCGVSLLPLVTLVD